MKPFVGTEELDIVEKVLDSGYMTEGPRTHRFEEEFARYIGTRYAIATTNCTTALEIALRIIGIGSGDEVIVPDFTYPASAQAVENVGGTSVLVDVDLDSRQISVPEIERALTGRTKCVMPVSLFGNGVDMEPIKELQKEHDFITIEDAAGSMGVEINGEKVGKQADISCFSFHPRKVITTGEGGMIVTDNHDWARDMKMYKKFGMDPKGNFVFWGTNCKLSDILGGIGLVQLGKVDDIIEMRRSKAAVYNSLLEDTEGVRLPEAGRGVRYTYQSYSMLLDDRFDRDEIIKRMRERGIQCQIGTYALSEFSHFDSTRKIGSLENSKRLYRQLLTLPLHHLLTEDDQGYVVSSLKEIFRGYQ